MYTYRRWCCHRPNVRCVLQERLTREWEEAIAAFSRAVAELTRAMGTASQEEIERLHADAEELRNAAQDAREQLDAHLNEHGCEISS